MIEHPLVLPFVLAALWAIWKGAARGLRWIARTLAREVSDNIVSSIGDTLSLRWKNDMDEALKPIRLELSDNGGSSLKDAVKRIDVRLQNVEQQLETEIMQDRFDEPTGTEF